MHLNLYLHSWMNVFFIASQINLYHSLQNSKIATAIQNTNYNEYTKYKKYYNGHTKHRENKRKPHNTKKSFKRTFEL